MGTIIAGVIAMVAGDFILSLFGISVADVQLAGGLPVLLLIALSMLQGAANTAHAETPKEAVETRQFDPADVAVDRLTIPPGGAVSGVGWGVGPRRHAS